MIQLGIRITAFRLFLYSMITAGTLFYIYQTLDLFANPAVLSGVEYGGLGFRLLFAVVVTPACMVMGMLVIRRVPENIVGFLLLLYAISLTGIWTRADVDTRGVRELYLLSNYSVGTLSNLLFPCFLYYFPSGKVFPVRLTSLVNAGFVLAWAGGFIQLLATPDLSITHGELLQFSSDMTNPFFVPILGDYLSLIRLTIGIGSILWMVFIIGGLVSIVFRYRRGNDTERQKSNG